MYVYECKCVCERGRFDKFAGKILSRLPCTFDVSHVVVTDRQTDSQTDRQTDRQTDGRTDNQRDKTNAY